MNDFKIGDTCWTWSLTVFGSYIPFFSEYEITDIINNGKIIFVCLSHEYQADMAMPINFIFKSKGEAIDSLINMLSDMQDE